MTVEKAIDKAATTAKSSEPLELLASLLNNDMAAVNAMILQRMDSGVPLISQIARYLIMAGGKRIRPLLTLATSRLYGGTNERPYRLAAAVEFIHTATLLHDDVVDESTERRGKEAAAIVFGNKSSVLVGDFLFSRAFQLMVEDGSIDVLGILSEASAVIAQGEVMQLQTTGNLATSMEEYKSVVGAKTAALFAAACEIGPVMEDAGDEARRAMKDYGYNLGMAFQIADDLLDYKADRLKLGKTIGDDFREGKMTAPVIIALEKATAEERQFWQRTFVDKNQTEEDLGHALSLLEHHNAFAAGMDMAGSYAAKAREALDKAQQGEIKEILAEVIDFTISRNY